MMKIPARLFSVRLGFLAGALAVAYVLGRWPGPLAKWEGVFPAAWQRLISKTWTAPGAAALAAPLRQAEDWNTPLSLKAALDRITKILAGDFKQDDKAEAIKNIIYRINSADKTALFKMISDLPNSRKKTMLQEALINSLLGPPGDVQNPALALSLSKQVENGELRRDLINRSLSELADNDPKDGGDLQLAISEFAKLPSVDVDPQNYGDILGALAKLHPADAEAAATQLPPGRAREDAIDSVAMTLAGDNPQAAINWMLSLPPSDNPPWDDLLEVIGGTDLKLDTAVVDKILDSSTRASAIRTVFFDYLKGPSADPAVALDWLKQTAPSSDYNDTVDTYIQCLSNGDEDTAFAATLAGNIADPLTRLSETTALATKWGAEAPQAALAWAANLTDFGSITRNGTLVSVVSSWATINPVAAAAYIQNSPDPSLYLSLAPAIAQTWAGSGPSSANTPPPGTWTSSDPAAALTWVNSLPDSDAKSQALGNVLVGVAKTDFTTAWNDASSLPATDNPEAVMGNLVGVEAQQNPAQAAAMLSQFPADATQLSATTAVATTWAKQDPQALSNWINTLPPGAERDASVEQLVAAQTVKDPSGSFTWANTLSNPDLRASQIQTVLTSWAGADLTAALNAIQSANLTDPQRDALTQTLSKVASVVSPNTASGTP